MMVLSSITNIIKQALEEDDKELVMDSSLYGILTNYMLLCNRSNHTLMFIIIIFVL